jgi:hypothetical protein
MVMDLGVGHLWNITTCHGKPSIATIQGGIVGTAIIV